MYHCWLRDHCGRQILGVNAPGSDPETGRSLVNGVLMLPTNFLATRYVLLRFFRRNFGNRPASRVDIWALDAERATVPVINL